MRRQGIFTHESGPVMGFVSGRGLNAHGKVTRGKMKGLPDTKNGSSKPEDLCFSDYTSRLSQSYSQPVLALREAGQAEDYEVGDDECAKGDRRDGRGYRQHAVQKVVEEVKYHNVSQVHRKTAH